MHIKESGGIRRRPGRSLGQTLAAGLLALMVAMGIGRFAFTPILPVIQNRFDLSNAASATLASSNYLGYLLGAVLAAFVPAGRLQDALLRASLWTVAAATVLMGLTADFSAWFTLRFVAGLAGAGVLVLASAVVLEELWRRGQLRFSGILYSGPGLGIVVSGLVVLLLGGLLEGEPAAWRGGWLILGALAFMLVLTCVAWLPAGKAAHQSTSRVPHVATPEEGTARFTARVATGAIFALAQLGLAYFLEGFGYIVTGTILPTIIESLPGLRGLGAGAWVLVGFAAIPSTMLWMGAASRMGAVTALGVAFTMQAAGILLPALSSAPWAAAGSAVLFGGTFTGIAALTLTHARQLMGTRGTGLALGLLTAMFGVGQVLGPLVACFADGAGGFRLALVAASAAVALGGLLMPAVGFVGTINARHGKECVHDTGN
jgi:MFS family permease